MIYGWLVLIDKCTCWVGSTNHILMQREPQTKPTAPHMSISYAYAYLCIYIFSNWEIHLSGNAQRIIFFFRYNYHILKANILNNYYGMSQSYTLSLNINITKQWHVLTKKKAEIHTWHDFWEQSKHLNELKTQKF